jgi:hypothetical protein
VRYRLLIWASVAVGAAVAFATSLGMGSPVAAAKSESRDCSFLPPPAPTQNRWRPAERALVPFGPSEIRLCRYALRKDARGSDRDRLVGHGLATGTQASRLVQSFDALRAGKRRGRFTSCFADDAPVVVYFEYPGRRSVTVFVVTSNCWSATNGDLTRSAGELAWPRLRKQLLGMTRG